MGRPSVTLTASPNPTSFIGMVAWSWYIATTASYVPAWALRTAVSAPMGPSTIAPSPAPRCRDRMFRHRTRDQGARGAGRDEIRPLIDPGELRSSGTRCRAAETRIGEADPRGGGPVANGSLR